ncbi:MAG: hypothetical protein GX615_04235, partial [Lentisphaerae bacterium]|nr:hypothetical protein [Lentisphaerota bacterium]
MREAGQRRQEVVVDSHLVRQRLAIDEFQHTAALLRVDAKFDMGVGDHPEVAVVMLEANLPGRGLAARDGRQLAQRHDLLVGMGCAASGVLDDDHALDEHRVAWEFDRGLDFLRASGVGADIELPGLQDLAVPVSDHDRSGNGIGG